MKKTCDFSIQTQRKTFFIKSKRLDKPLAVLLDCLRQRAQQMMEEARRTTRMTSEDATITAIIYTSIHLLLKGANGLVLPFFLPRLVPKLVENGLEQCLYTSRPNFSAQSMIEFVV